MKNSKLSLVGAAVAVAAMTTARSVNHTDAPAAEHPENWKKRLQSLTTHPKVPAPIKADVQKALDEIASQKARIIELEKFYDAHQDDFK